jgi:hypothetical protein
LFFGETLSNVILFDLGVEAPRNSLELEEEPPLPSSKDENLNIPVSFIMLAS